MILWSVHSCFHWCKNYINRPRKARIIVENKVVPFFYETPCTILTLTGDRALFDKTSAPFHYILFISDLHHCSTWRFGLMVTALVTSTKLPYAGCGDCVRVQLQVMEIYFGLTNHRGQLSLAIPYGLAERVLAMVFWPPPGKKRRVLRDSRPCNQDCWHTGLVD